jgi:uncharacterized membrane protein YfcA
MRVRELGYMGKKKQARKLREEIEPDDKKGHLDWFLVNCFFLCSIIGLFILLLITEYNPKDYYYLHNGAFVAILLTILSFIVRRSVNDHMYNSLRKLIHTGDALSLYEKGDVALSLTYLMAFISFFVIDFSFLKNYGLRVSAVAAVGVYELLRKFVFSKN